MPNGKPGRYWSTMRTSLETSLLGLFGVTRDPRRRTRMPHRGRDPRQGRCRDTRLCRGELPACVRGEDHSVVPRRPAGEGCPMTITMRTVAVNGVKHYAIAWDRTLCGRGPVEEIGS